MNADYIDKDKGVTSTGPVVNSDGYNEFTLSVPGTPFFNNSNVVCIIYLVFNHITSDIAKLYIQGMLTSINIAGHKTCAPTVTACV